MKLLATLAFSLLLLAAVQPAEAQESEQRVVENETLQVGLMKARSAVRNYRGLVRSQNMSYIVDAVFEAAQAHYLITEHLDGEGADDPDREDLELIQMGMERLGSDIARDMIEQGPAALRQSGPQFVTFLEIIQVRLDKFTAG